MASSSKKKTTMAKHQRENAVRDRQIRKAAKKARRKLEAANPPSELTDAPAGDDAENAPTEV
ncbi:MAG: hypothetical protein QOH13_2679 [Thermoleophilaceae bacterium]|jgi:hypothetical protein|nr:hypothetical protein [Thermoleophilaceae bacterium]